MVIVVRKRVARNPKRVQQEMEEIFRSLLSDRSGIQGRRNGPWRPHLEVFESDRGLIVLAEIAGADEDSLEITADTEMLTICGIRTASQAESKRIYRETGIAYGPFSADVYLPFPVDLEQISAEYERGLLRVDLPRVAPRTIVPRRTDASSSNGRRSTNG